MLRILENWILWKCASCTVTMAWLFITNNGMFPALYMGCDRRCICTLSLHRKKCLLIMPATVFFQQKIEHLIYYWKNWKIILRKKLYKRNLYFAEKCKMKDWIMCIKNIIFYTIEAIIIINFFVKSKFLMKSRINACNLSSFISSS